MIVVDIGCATHPAYPEDESIGTLINRFRPSAYFGFDPHPSVDEAEFVMAFPGLDPVNVTFNRSAAWIYDGVLDYKLDWNPLRAHTVESTTPATPVPCFDLARWLWALKSDVVLKLDCEGAEYDLIEHLEQTGAMGFVSPLLVEFHGDRERPYISVPWEEW